MSLARVALYLEYIAFCLRRELAPTGEPMSKSKDESPPVMSLNGTAEVTAEPKAKSKLVKDPEALALAAIMEILSKLESKPRARVLEYVYDRFKVEQPA